MQDDVFAGEIEAMRKKGRRKKKKFSAAKQARSRAREELGTPPPTRAVPSKKHKPPKHKKGLIEREIEGI
jgi:hypothetical protein